MPRIPSTLQSPLPHIPEPPPKAKKNLILGRGGATFNAARDGDRLARQHSDVWSIMRDKKWRTLAEIADMVDHPEASISARLRDFRKEQFGSHTVDRVWVNGRNHFVYRLTPNRPMKTAPKRGRVAAAA